MNQQVAQTAIPYSMSAKARPDGSYVASVKRPDGKWRDVRVPKAVAAAPNFKAAEKWILRHLPELAAGAAPSALADEKAAEAAKAKLTFSGLGPTILAKRDAYFDQQKRSEATRYEFRTHWTVHLEPYFGSMAPHEIEHHHANDFIAHLNEKHAPRTVRNIFKTLGVAFQVVRAHGLDPKLTTNKARDWVEGKLVTLPAVEDEPVAFVPRADAAKLLACAAVPEHRRARYALAFLSGMRDGEIAGLAWATSTSTRRRSTSTRPCRSRAGRPRRSRSRRRSRASASFPCTPSRRRTSSVGSATDGRRSSASILARRIPSSRTRRGSPTVRRRRPTTCGPTSRPRAARARWTEWTWTSTPPARASRPGFTRRASLATSPTSCSATSPTPSAVAITSAAATR